MKDRRLESAVFILTMALAAAAPGRAQAPPDSGARVALLRLYAQQDSAISHRDPHQFLPTLAPGYTVILRNGQRFTRPGIDSAITRDMRATTGMRLAGTELTRVSRHGDTLVAVVVHRADRDLVDAEGRAHRYENGVRHEERWVASRGQWRIVQLRELDQLYLRRDGIDQMPRSQPPRDSSQDSAVRAVAERYLHGLEFNDTVSLREAFWPEARLLFVGRDNQVGQMTQTQWYATFAGNVGHEEDGNLRITALEVTHDAASAKVEENYPRSRYTDYISLLRINGRWWIVNKIYTVEPRSP
jgi:hypothetical protein